MSGSLLKSSFAFLASSSEAYCSTYMLSGPSKTCKAPWVSLSLLPFVTTIKRRVWYIFVSMISVDPISHTGASNPKNSITPKGAITSLFEINGAASRSFFSLLTVMVFCPTDISTLALSVSIITFLSPSYLTVALIKFAIRPMGKNAWPLLAMGISLVSNVVNLPLI